MKIKVQDLKEGMCVDLQDDPFAVCDDEECTMNIAHEYEYAVVEGIEQETPECVRVDFEGESIGFPTNHEVEVQ